MERREPEREREPGETPPREVTRADGRRERYDAATLAASIHRAALAVGQGELLLAEELAALVTFVLGADHPAGTVARRAIRATTERVLMETGHHDVARSYILQQARESEVEVEESSPV